MDALTPIHTAVTSARTAAKRIAVRLREGPGDAGVVIETYVVTVPTFPFESPALTRIVLFPAEMPTVTVQAVPVMKHLVQLLPSVETST
jgi:hypothetical protein